jgi:hypothetical protein
MPAAFEVVAGGSTGAVAARMALSRVVVEASAFGSAMVGGSGALSPVLNGA